MCIISFFTWDIRLAGFWKPECLCLGLSKSFTSGSDIKVSEMPPMARTGNRNTSTHMEYVVQAFPSLEALG